MRHRASALACALAVTSVLAQSPAAPAPAKPAPAKPAPTPREQAKARALNGPVKITAERADLDRAQAAVYRGNVHLTSADLELTGDRLELRQPLKGQFTVQLTGTPAHLRHAAVADAPEINATAPHIDYDTRTALVVLSGGAVVTRGTDQVTSDTVQYNVTARRISASGFGKGQVQMVVQPPPGTNLDLNLKDKKPSVKQNKK